MDSLYAYYVCNDDPLRRTRPRFEHTLDRRRCYVWLGYKITAEAYCIHGVSAASGAPPARRRVLARVGPGGTAAVGVPAPVHACECVADTYAQQQACNAPSTAPSRPA